MRWHRKAVQFQRKGVPNIQGQQDDVAFGYEKEGWQAEKRWERRGDVLVR
jgi:hypothetical protein